MTARPRWSVCIGGYPLGWEPPMLQTDDPAAAIAKYETVRARLRSGGYLYTTVAIFDDNGEGEPLDPDRVRELDDKSYPALYDSDHRPDRLPDWWRLVWWCERHARSGRASALPLFWQMFSEGRRS